MATKRPHHVHPAPECQLAQSVDGTGPVAATALEVLVAVGSNVDAAANIRLALQLLQDGVVVRVMRVSPFYQSPALDRNGLEILGESYSNGAILLSTDLDLISLRTYLRQVEAIVGRERAPHAAVAVDLDVVMARDSSGNDIIVSSEELRLPDTDVLTRSYLAIPLADIAPGWRYPNSDLSLQDISASFAHTRLESIEL